MLVTPPTLPPDLDPDASRSDATPSFTQLGNPGSGLSAPTTLHKDKGDMHLRAATDTTVFVHGFG